MTTATPQVRVGVGVFVLKSARASGANPHFLLGKRRGSLGAGTYALPGGHQDFGETPEACAAREVLEETGLKVVDIKFLTATNSFMPEERKHYITLFMVCVRESNDDQAQNLEPHKCEGWEWTSWEELLALHKVEKEASDGAVLERKLFRPLHSLFEQRPGLLPSRV